jgi:hypothetical protein
MSKVTKGWNFNLEKAGRSEALRDPLGFKQNTTDVMVRSSTGPRNMTQIEVLESVCTSKVVT